MGAIGSHGIRCASYESGILAVANNVGVLHTDSKQAETKPQERKGDAMGSTGTDRFTDYPGTPGGSAKGRGTRGGKTGDGTEVDQCEVDLASVALEEVARCDYFAAHNSLPAVDTPVAVRTTLVGGRLGVETTDGREVVGLLPTEYNYLLQCMKQGYAYRGRVCSVKPRPVPVVRVDMGHSR